MRAAYGWRRNSGGCMRPRRRMRLTTISIPGVARRPSMPSASCPICWKGDSRLLEAVLQLRMRTRPMQRASSARTDLRARAAPTGLGRHDDRLPAGHQEGGRSGQTDQGPFDESSDPRLRDPLSEHPGRRLCRQSLIRIACPCRKETRAAEKDQAQELTRTAGSAPPGSPGFHVRLQRPLRQLTWPNGTFA